MKICYNDTLNLSVILGFHACCICLYFTQWNRKNLIGKSKSAQVFPFFYDLNEWDPGLKGEKQADQYDTPQSETAL